MVKFQDIMRSEFKALKNGIEITEEEVECMCNLWFNITESTYHRFQIDGDLRESLKYMSAEKILWYTTRRNKNHLIDVLNKLVSVYS